MSTRATYTITTNRGVLTFYIHHDGYPEGACIYFENMVEYENKRGDSRDHFLRANEGAEITKKWSHADIEYHYEYHEQTNILEMITIDIEGEKTTTFKDKLTVFLNKYTNR